ncbi:3-oxoacyl-ACP synthase III family protein [Catenulispora rubra]|uniref:3-oxoacyl-ACP synthase III family protein n=1 Tax=Catenulispora rubra TaxID=280293 RepID=UPI0018923B47|nr:3-oxoacyl-ACP synthase III family protein [Catenulispora rubra]
MAENTVEDVSDFRLLSAGSALPGPPLDNAALARRLRLDGVWSQWIDEFIGPGTRHLALDLEDGCATATLVDLGAEAGRRALDAAGMRARDVDVMVFASATPDSLLPTTVNLVAERLGVNGIPTYQLQSGCAGAYQAIDLGRQLLLAPGRRNALVLGGDILVKHFDLDIDVGKLSPGELVNMLLFGDGAGAAVLTRDRVPGTTAVRQVLNKVTGAGRAPGQQVEWFGLADRHLDLPAAREDYKAIQESVPSMSREIVKELLERTRWAEHEIDYLLPPQLSGKMAETITEELQMPGAEEISCVTETANTGNAVPFIQLERLLPQMVAGDRALGVTVESSKWITAGFALERT